MTNAQKWVSVFLVLFVLLLMLSRLTKREDDESDSYYGEETVSMNESQEINVQSLLANNRCLVCHGRDLSGSGMGPSLANVNANWNATNLASYLENPKAFLDSPRMAVLEDKYSSVMPAVKNLTQEEINAIVEYLLAK